MTRAYLLLGRLYPRLNIDEIQRITLLILYQEEVRSYGFPCLNTLQNYLCFIA